MRGSGLALCLVLAFSPPAIASGLQVTTGQRGQMSPDGQVDVPARVTWNNAWRNARNHDAVWLFAKVRPAPSAGWAHARIASITVRTASSRVECWTPDDRIGAFCTVAEPHRGDVTADVMLTLDVSRLDRTRRESPALAAEVLGLEMVHIPKGPFFVGNPDPQAADRSALYRVAPGGAYGGAYRIASEDAIAIAATDDALYYQAKQPQYQGDQQGPVPAAFPKGTRAFYVMKYEIQQGEYATFLNMIHSADAYFRAPFAGPRYYDERGTIRLDGERYVAGAPQRPANWISWDDGIAFADWAGLRPMTELEYVKAARGPVEPTGIDRPWGAEPIASMRRVLLPNGDLANTGEADESRLSDDTRAALGASFYWVMDLAGSVWERVVSLGHPKGRAFRGTHGDGQLRAYGIATNEDWPSGDHDGGGYGYKGGGHYELEQERTRTVAPLDLNPWSPVDWRNYAAWGAAPRSVAYGFRAVRTDER